MSYREELQNYINQNTGLVGYGPNVANYSTGNPLLETGTAYVLLFDEEGYSYPADLWGLDVAFSHCKAATGFYVKKPSTIDEITHDDIIGMVAATTIGTTAFMYSFADHEIVQYGNANNWVLSSTGKFYWDAWAKPWHKAFYKMAALEHVGVIGLGFLAAAILIDAYFNKDNASDKRLTWIMLKALKGKSKVMDLVSKVWYKRLRAGAFGSMKNVFKAYHGENHIFTRYCKE